MIEWKPVKDYEGIYEVSSEGDVRRILGGRGRPAGKLMTPNILPNGYALFHLCHEGERKAKYAHRLVAEAFICQGEGEIQVNHKNCEKLDNRVENLEWVTPSENIRHGYENGAHRWKTAA
jgi:hypothetical protein